jgi:hypothetical protein
MDTKDLLLDAYRADLERERCEAGRLRVEAAALHELLNAALDQLARLFAEVDRVKAENYGLRDERRTRATPPVAA